LGTSRQGAASIESAEANGSITLKSLRRTAEALHCDLVYAIVPRRTLTEIVDAQARVRATAVANRAAHTMALERQETLPEETNAQVHDLARRLRSEWARDLWDDRAS
jgi:predicted DNA-binding mobile mystery protein A